MSGDRRDDLATNETAEHDEGFLTRWSERKTLARQGVELPEPEESASAPSGADDATGDQADAAAGEVAGTDAAAEPVELPPLDSLDEDSDYSPFLAAGVPPDLRRDALRKLFHSPKFNVRDGLDDYDLDFTNPEPLGDGGPGMQVDDFESDEPEVFAASDETDETIEADDEQPRAS